MLAHDDLPDDVPALKALLIERAQQDAHTQVRLAAREAELMAHTSALALAQAELAALKLEHEKLQALVAVLNRHRFGRRSETLSADQLALGLEDNAQGLAALDEAIQRKTPATRRPPRARNLGSLPAGLPRIETTLDVADKSCPCCQAPMVAIGEDVAERLDIVPQRLRVLVTRRPKYACRSCQTHQQQPAPPHIIEGGLPSEALIASIVVAKYADALPLYRQAAMFAREGIALDRATLCDWVGRASWWLRPLHERLLEHLRGSAKLFADETPAPVLDPGRGRTKTGQLWAYARDDRPWAGSEPPAVAYVYAPGRGSEHPLAHLKGFSGVLQVDGYAAYGALTRQGVTLAHCWSHCRRRYYELATAGAAPVASEALLRIAKLYEIEAEIRGTSAENRQRERQLRTRPLVEAFKAWLDSQALAASRGSPLADAIRYAINHWQGLTRFLDDGRIEIDSNTVERAIKPLTMTRKSSLFAGSDGGAATWACAASLIETCRLNDINPQHYLADILARLAADYPASEVDALLPWQWATGRKPDG